MSYCITDGEIFRAEWAVSFSFFLLLQCKSGKVYGKTDWKGACRLTKSGNTIHNMFFSETPGFGQVMFFKSHVGQTSRQFAEQIMSKQS